eukprot:scaffold3787_cov258-Pinguiococcus_pyrenoidosus.AAC.8
MLDEDVGIFGRLALAGLAQLCRLELVARLHELLRQLQRLPEVRWAPANAVEHAQGERAGEEADQMVHFRVETAGGAVELPNEESAPVLRCAHEVSFDGVDRIQVGGAELHCLLSAQKELLKQVLVVAVAARPQRHHPGTELSSHRADEKRQDVADFGLQRLGRAEHRFHRLVRFARIPCFSRHVREVLEFQLDGRRLAEAGIPRHRLGDAGPEIDVAEGHPGC